MTGNERQGRHVVGVYPLLLDETCWFIAADFDKANWTRTPSPPFGAFPLLGGTPLRDRQSTNPYRNSYAPLLRSACS